MKNYLVLTLIICGLLFSCKQSDDTGETTSNDTNEEVVDMRDITSMELVADMKPGWNLGNSLDAEGIDETVWGNPVVTKALIDKIKERGFGTLRVPVTWRFHQGGAPNYIIEASWLDRVEEVVNYGLDNDMYVIVNIHHDEEWIIPTYALADDVKDRLQKTWTQIANRFKDYNDYLIFETLNEPRYEGQPQEWSGTPEWRDVVNQYHKTSLDAIRATGGNNSLRHIMISSYAAGQGTIDDLVIPNNDIRTIVSIHNYFPFEFSLSGTDTTWGTPEDKAQMDGTFDQIYNKFIVNNKPVIMGEWGSLNHNDTNTEDRINHASYYANALASRNILPIWWDNGNNDEYALINRNTLQWNFPKIADAIIESQND
ncbi:glycoside hydrolase family 5 protein [uncultured Algibacter sp.]|uniref:glycoside hydrolase family 5 protein n=1 Tax=uncultured Algibacter sp. TaxID=298659 RepID=UPI003217AAF2